MKTKQVMLIIFVSLFFIADNNLVLSQNFPVGYRDITFHDPARNRNIGTTVYYPAIIAGKNQPMAVGEFPLVVFGHGFMMGVDAYKNFGDTLGKAGYILVLPKTEGGLPPSHGAFGLDLRFLNTHVKGLNSDTNSIFFNKLAETSAIMGHSMGGGSSMLAAANNADLTTLVNFAAAETSPSAVAVSPDITVPVVMFIGANDGVTPPSEHQLPMYNALTTSCKTLISINGGAHCFYALSNWACDFGQSTTSPQPTITREKQHKVVFSLLMPYLDYMLKDNMVAKDLFLIRLNTSTDITFETNCYTHVPIQKEINFSIYPNPATNKLFIEFDEVLDVGVEVYDMQGRLSLVSCFNSNNHCLDIGNLDVGIYFIKLKVDSQILYNKLIVY